MATNKAGKFTSVVNTKAVWIEDHLLRASDVVNDEPTVAGATVKVALAAISALITASTSAVQTLSNKSLVDNSTFFVNAADNTKKINLDLSGFTTGIARIWTVPAFSGTVILGGNYNTTNLSVGASSSAFGTNATAVGPSASAGGADSVSLGVAASASAAQCTALGRSALASAGSATAVGNSSTANGSRGTAFGASSYASTDCSVFGYLASANSVNSFSSSFGASSGANFIRASAFGYGSLARAESVALGANAITRTTDETAVGSAANTYSQGTACGRAAVGATLGVAMGYYSATNNTGAVALGANATASWNNSIALGRGATTTVDNELAIRVGNSSTTELRTPLTTDATARATLVTHLPVTLNGVTYYIKLYQT